MKKFTKDTLWMNCHGVINPLKDLSDSHLANLYQFAKFYCTHTNLASIVKSIIKDRKLHESFLERSQIPYKNPEGEWEIWDFENHKPKVISGKLIKKEKQCPICLSTKRALILLKNILKIGLL